MATPLETLPGAIPAVHGSAAQVNAQSAGATLLLKIASSRMWIVDIDGTVALKTARHWYDWARVEEDVPHVPVVTVVQALAAAGKQIVFATGRMEQCRAATVRWLHSNICTPEGTAVCHSPLYMRPDDDYRPDEVLKLEIYRTHIEPVGPVEGVLDDRNVVVAMWRDLGLTVLQCALGDF